MYPLVLITHKPYMYIVTIVFNDLYAVEPGALGALVLTKYASAHRNLVFHNRNVSCYLIVPHNFEWVQPPLWLYIRLQTPAFPLHWWSAPQTLTVYPPDKIKPSLQLYFAVESIVNPLTVTVPLAKGSIGGQVITTIIKCINESDIKYSKYVMRTYIYKLKDICAWSVIIQLTFTR